MANVAFDEFIRRRQSERTAAMAAFDPDQRLGQWRERLQQLYDLVEQFTAPYRDAGDAAISYEDVELNEEFSGPYTVRKLRLTVAGSTIVFKPIGTMLIGSSGRVDLIGPRGTARVGLVDRAVRRASELVHVTVRLAGAPPEASPATTPDWVWKIITPAPRMQFVELTEANFFDMILSIADA